MRLVNFEVGTVKVLNLNVVDTSEYNHKKYAV